jgi:hypothetical protein
MTRRVNRPHKKAGRKLKQPPAVVDTPKVIEALAATGIGKVTIAKRLGTTKDLLNRWLAENAELAEAFERGRDARRNKIEDRLYRIGMNGDVSALIFLLRAAHGYRTDGPVNDGGNRVSITFTLPGAMKPEDFYKVIEHDEPSPDVIPLPAARTRRS